MRRLLPPLGNVIEKRVDEGVVASDISGHDGHLMTTALGTLELANHE